MHIYQPAKCCEYPDMNVYATRKENLLRLMRTRTKAACADKWDTSASTLSQITSQKANRNLGDSLARKIERAEGLPPGWLDSRHEMQGVKTAQSVMDGGATYGEGIAPAPNMSGSVPLISWIQAGSWTEVCDLDALTDEYVPLPPGASNETFALRVRGQSMLPKYEPDLIIYVDPAVAPYDGDDVIAVLTDHNEATFKQLVQEPDGQRLLKARNPSWPDPWLAINGNCQIVGVVIGALWLRKPRA